MKKTVRWLRNTLYVDGRPFATFFAREDPNENIYALATRMRFMDYRAGHDTDVEVFEFEDDAFAAALEAARRGDKRMDEKQRGFHIVFDWVMSRIQLLGEGATFIVSPDPIPLSREELMEVFEKVSQTPEYRHHQLVGMTKDREVVAFKA